MAYTREQQRIIREIRKVADHTKAPRKEELAAYMTGRVETNFRNLKYGDADSQGWRQERASLYKNPTDVGASVRRFFGEMKSVRGKHATPGKLAQAVQRSAYPERYAEHRKEAAKLYKRGKAEHRKPAGSHPLPKAPPPKAPAPAPKAPPAHHSRTKPGKPKAFSGARTS